MDISLDDVWGGKLQADTPSEVSAYSARNEGGFDFGCVLGPKLQRGVEQTAPQTPPPSTPTIDIDSIAQSVTPEVLNDLSGTTSARSKKMTRDEYALMLYKRKLRNRLSASRSRKRHQCDVKRLQLDIEELDRRSDEILAKCEQTREETARLKSENTALMCENTVYHARLRLLFPQY